MGTPKLASEKNKPPPRGAGAKSKIKTLPRWAGGKSKVKPPPRGVGKNKPPPRGAGAKSKVETPAMRGGINIMANNPAIIPERLFCLRDYSAVVDANIIYQAGEETA
jgi:hypothetical protein